MAAGSFLGGLAGGSIGSAVVQLILDDSKYKAQMAGAQASTTSATGAMGKSASRFGAAGVLAFTAVGTAVLAFAADSVRAASSLEEAANKAKVSFGAAAGTVENFAKSAASSAGVSEAAALEAAGGFGVMLQTAGLTQEAAADMSVSLVTLASDLASFNNIAIEGADGALAKLRGGLAGEAEPLRRLGILLSEARVKAEAYASGIAENGAELTEAQKVQARYNLILQDSSIAQGDFARTSDSLANAQRIMTAEIENAKAEIGQELLPVLAELLPALSDLATTILPQVASALDEVVDHITPAIQGFNDLADAIAGIGGGAGGARGGNAAIDFLTALIPEGDPGKSLTDQFMEAVLTTADEVREARDTFSSFFEGIRSDGEGLFEFFAEDLPKGFDFFFDEMDGGFGDLGLTVQRFADLAGEDMKEWRASVAESIEGTFGSISNFDGKWRQAAGNFRQNAVKMAQDAREFTGDLRQLDDANIGDSIKKALLDEGPAAVHAYVESNRKGQADIREAIRTSSGELDKQERLIRDISGAVDDVSDVKTIEVVVNYSYNGYDASKPIPGGVVD